MKRTNEKWNGPNGQIHDKATGSLGIADQHVLTTDQTRERAAGGLHKIWLFDEMPIVQNAMYPVIVSHDTLYDLYENITQNSKVRCKKRKFNKKMLWWYRIADCDRKLGTPILVMQYVNQTSQE